MTRAPLFTLANLFLVRLTLAIGAAEHVDKTFPGGGRACGTVASLASCGLTG